jgi:hypothetical protein
MGFGIRGCKVDDQLEFCRLLDRQIARPFPLENAPDIGAGHPGRIQRIGRIADQSASYDLLPPQQPE